MVFVGYGDCRGLSWAVFMKEKTSALGCPWSRTAGLVWLIRVWNRQVAVKNLQREDLYAELEL